MEIKIGNAEELETQKKIQQIQFTVTNTFNGQKTISELLKRLIVSEINQSENQKAN